MKNNKVKYVMLAFVSMFVVIFGISFAMANGEKEASDGKIKGQYIVVFKDDVEDPSLVADEIVKTHNLGHLNTYKNALKGFAATIPDTEIDKVKNDPRVKFVSEDRVVSIDSMISGKPDSGQIASQAAQVLPTGVNRIDAELSASKGAGVATAIIDTGIDYTHPDLAGQVAGGINCSGGSVNNYKDGNGHGTHVAGTIAALDNSIGVVGVAPKSKLLAVRVLNNSGSGTWSSVICGIDWVTANAKTKNIKVANMSLGGGGTSDNNCGNTNNDAMHKAICKSRDAGVAYVVAAGNENDNASNHTPAAYDDAVITVSALADSDGKSFGAGSATNYGSDDTFATFSNYGSVVDLGAPGVNILSTWKGGAYNTISGTSMASPHVAGAAALYISVNPSANWTQVRDALKNLGEILGNGHTDPSGKHLESVVKVGSL